MWIDHMVRMQVETSAEELLIIKTTRPLLDHLSDHVKTHHPYE